MHGEKRKGSKVLHAVGDLFLEASHAVCNFVIGHDMEGVHEDAHDAVKEEVMIGGKDTKEEKKQGEHQEF